jgi:hypothetical protein
MITITTMITMIMVIMMIMMCFVQPRQALGPRSCARC